MVHPSCHSLKFLVPQILSNDKNVLFEIINSGYIFFATKYFFVITKIRSVDPTTIRTGNLKFSCFGSHGPPYGNDTSQIICNLCIWYKLVFIWYRYENGPGERVSINVENFKYIHTVSIFLIQWEFFYYLCFSSFCITWVTKNYTFSILHQQGKRHWVP